MQVFHSVDAERGDAQQWDVARAAASAAIAAGEVICLPTDTVYGIGADPFNADAVTALLSAKSRTRAMPPPVLVADAKQAARLVDPAVQRGEVAEIVHTLIENFWPGALTIILPAAPTIGWDLGETNGTVALRMPDHPVALALLQTVGPLAVTSANQTGRPPATTIAQAVQQLGEAVSVYLDAGTSPGGVPSTIVRLSADTPQQADLIRRGALNPSAIARTAGIAISEPQP
ncbi:MAG: L-threonylcarbamoyladenylate synthase [Actinomycetaceae bacterium]|nr:threonylcarbamoyl-AMP synthase [Arcanobacterium sp.]MDD7687471.1 L-threonylcarbamoyladenylate synthase [Actinomycetaceae bacterium]MDY5272946.1 L-threonylcarbamoyladenylate synthase [Arcanobacterium sp.]